MFLRWGQQCPRGGHAEFPKSARGGKGELLVWLAVSWLLAGGCHASRMPATIPSHIRGTGMVLSPGAGSQQDLPCPELPGSDTHQCRNLSYW